VIAEAVTHDGTISAIRRTELPTRLLCGKTQCDGQEHKTGENGGGFHGFNHRSSVNSSIEGHSSLHAIQMWLQATCQQTTDCKDGRSTDIS
jgi:hypothetical protein